MVPAASLQVARVKLGARRGLTNEINAVVVEATSIGLFVTQPQSLEYFKTFFTAVSAKCIQSMVGSMEPDVDCLGSGASPDPCEFHDLEQVTSPHAPVSLPVECR